MDTWIVSKPTTRLVMAILVSVSASAGLAQQETAGSLAITGRVPAWGTSDSSVLTLMAADFGSMDEYQRTLTGTGVAANVRVCNKSGILYTDCLVQAGVPLPSGALIEYMELAACDEDLNLGVTASLYVWEGLQQDNPPPVASITTQGVSGCLFWTTGAIGVTVDNLTNNYAVIVELPEGFVSFRSVRIFYRLQVSPAPNFATFNDVPFGSQYHQFVEALYASGITTGCGGGNFCPNAYVKRGQMAVFLAKALGLHWPN